MIILIGAVLAIGIYFYMQKTKTEESETNELKPFIPSKTFSGDKKRLYF